jgi:threonine dehydratase
MLEVPTIDDIRSAHGLVQRYVHRTPVLTCNALNEMTGASLYFKCENFQKGGAFKIRGATNAVFSLSDQQAARGVATHSSGNHAAALALAARWRGVTAHVVMPEHAPLIKKAAVAGYGAHIHYCGPRAEDREVLCRAVLAETGATFVHSYNNPRIIAGAGTASLELCEDVPDLDAVMVPIGGGGLISGNAIAVRAVSPETRVIGVEPEQADNTTRCIAAGDLVPASNRHTVADGLRMPLSELTFTIIKRYVADVATVTEEETVRAMRHLWERMKIVVEPSSAVVLAALLSGKAAMAGQRVGIILTGGNVDLERLPWR